MDAEAVPEECSAGEIEHDRVQLPLQYEIDGEHKEDGKQVLLSDQTDPGLRAAKGGQKIGRGRTSVFVRGGETSLPKVTSELKGQAPVLSVVTAFQ